MRKEHYYPKITKTVFSPKQRPFWKHGCVIEKKKYGGEPADGGGKLQC